MWWPFWEPDTSRQGGQDHGKAQRIGANLRGREPGGLLLAVSRIQADVMGAVCEPEGRWSDVRRQIVVMSVAFAATLFGGCAIVPSRLSGGATGVAPTATPCQQRARSVLGPKATPIQITEWIRLNDCVGGRTNDSGGSGDGPAAGSS